MEEGPKTRTTSPVPLLARILPARYLFAVLGSCGFAIIYGLKVNLSVAIVAMVNHTALAPASEAQEVSAGVSLPTMEPASSGGGGSGCGVHTRESTDVALFTGDGPFAWGESTQGYILASYFWGYMVTQLPGGRIAEVMSAKLVMLGAVLVNAVCTIITPLAAYAHSGGGALLAVRVAEGLGAGVTFPAMHVMISHWAPPEERSAMSSIIYSGTALGTVMSMSLSGALAASFGWESVFHVMGSLSLLWCVLWALLVADSPAEQRLWLICREERRFIQEALHPGEKEQRVSKEDLPVPWRAVLTSAPFWAILLSHICSNFGWYMLLIELPTYMSQILQFSIQENSGLSALPFLMMWIFSMVLGRFWGWSLKKKHVTITVTRKISTVIASTVPAICLLLVCYAGCDRVLVVSLMSVAVMCVGGKFSGFLSNHIDIAPNFAGTLVAITNTCATIPGFVVPILVGYVTHNNQTVDAWCELFVITAGLYMVETVVYVFLASGEEQSWNKPHQNKDHEVGTLKDSIHEEDPTSLIMRP